MPPSPPPHLSPQDFRQLGHQMIDWIADYMQRVESLPVLSQVKPGDVLAKLPQNPPEKGLGHSAAPVDDWHVIFDDLNDIILPGITHWQSPNFFAFFPCNASAPGILGELASAGLGVQGMLWATSPACTELEIRMMDWMAQLIGLPEDFHSTSPNGGGVIQGTASESTLVAMLAARKRIGHAPNPVVYASTQAHSSVIKAAMIAGIATGPQDKDNIRLIDVDQNLAMRPDLLEQAIREDFAAGKTPLCVTATVGTTGTTAIDPLGAIVEALDSCGFTSRRKGGTVGGWLHVDAALAGAACICPEHRWMLDGVEAADSICFNPHKWLLTNFDCDCFWTRDKSALINGLSVTPEYLRNAPSESGEVTDFRDWQIPLGRRFRALKLWFVIRHYGVRGLQTHIREHISLAEQFETWVRDDDRFEIPTPRTVNLVCFRLKSGDKPTRVLMDKLNKSGKLYLTHATLPDGRLILRMAIGAVTTEKRHVKSAWQAIQTAADHAQTQ